MNDSNPPRKKKLGPYKIIKALGTGYYAHTYLVKDVNGNHFAGKYFKDPNNEEASGRFKNEIFALKMANHESIPTLIDHHISEKEAYIIMTYAPGKPLREIIEQNNRNGGTHPYMSVIRVIRKLLEAVIHLHEKGIIHRDIQDNNVIYKSSTDEVTLIDLGVSKSPDMPVKHLTFLQAGKSVFNPPSKLTYPSKTNPKHDVFALGVLAYLMLTNEYPWKHDKAEDHGALVDLMTNIKIQKIHVLNNKVPIPVSEAFHEFLEIDDDERIEAKEALQKLDLLLKKMESAGLNTSSSKKNLRFDRLIRDPLHGDILLTEEEWKIINSREFQRLRYLKQLGLTDLVYPGASHSRFVHAIGTLHMANKILERIEKSTGEPFDLEEKLMVRLYALIHDVSHVSLGHTLEDELGFFPRHDDNLNRLDRLLFSSSSELGGILRSSSFGNTVLALMDPSHKIHKKNWVSEVVTSPTGADVLDYIDRDSFFCGLDHKVDSAIFRRFKIDRERRHKKSSSKSLLTKLYGHHGFRLDAEYAIQSILEERFALFLKVYSHPAKTSAGAMIGKAYGNLAKKKIKALSETNLEWMGDFEFLSILSSQKDSFSKLTKMVNRRRLYKIAFLGRILPKGKRTSHEEGEMHEKLKNLGIFDPFKRANIESELASKAGLNPSDIIVYCSPNPPGIKKFTHKVEEQKEGSSFERMDDWNRPIMEKHRSLWNIYVFINPELIKGKWAIIGRIAEDFFQIKNGISPGSSGSYKQGTLF